LQLAIDDLDCPVLARVPVVLCEMELDFGAAPESTLNESDPETVPVRSTAVSSPLVVKFEISAPFASETAALTAIATAVLNATMIASSSTAEMTLL
jgi:hypothetical protein